MQPSLRSIDHLQKSLGPHPSRFPVVQCSACQTPLPLGFSRAATCPHCKTKRQLDADLLRRRDRYRTTDHHRRLHDPLWQRALAARPRVFLEPTFLAASSYASPFVGIAVGYFFAFQHQKPALAALLGLCTVGILQALASLLFWWCKPVHVRGLVTARTTAPGDRTLLCRVCTLPLSVPSPDDAAPSPTDTTCDYCGADNLLTGSAAVAPRPDLYDVQAAHREVYGTAVQERTDRLFPLILCAGFFFLGALAYFTLSRHFPSE
ncbi:MAG TPA: hypothetical protein PKE31_09105 [Pseudomonadota bacterium]|nr:hypothetical protein [Pseudomonadota bacterium]